MKQATGRSIHGIVVIDKPEGISSFGAVQQVRAIIGASKAGHTGTLDPLATGVLAICLNEATKLVRFLIEHDKEYVATLTLGVETDTGDREGTVLCERPFPPLSSNEIEEVLQSFLGQIVQIPPPFSAKKKGGIPLYRMARKGIPVEADPVEVTIHSIDLVRVELPRISVHIRCSKGTYIRALARDIGRRIGCGAYLSGLRRTRCGPFPLERSCRLDRFREAWESEGIHDAFWTIEEAVHGWPSIVLDEGSLRKIRHGIPLCGQDLQGMEPFSFREGDDIVLFSPNRRIAAIARAIDRASSYETARGKPILKTVRLFLHESFAG